MLPWKKVSLPSCPYNFTKRDCVHLFCLFLFPDDRNVAIMTGAPTAIMSPKLNRAMEAIKDG
jgi:hypothetical protein